MTLSKDDLAINTIRGLAIDAIQKADSGHPGLPLGAAPMAYVLWSQFLKHNPKNPQWLDRDRFILSAGHGSMLLYSLLHLFGYDLPLEEVKNFRQWGSKTPGHPEFGHTAGVEATTGPLGQGAANAVGMAIAERKLANLFNRPNFEIIDHHTYALVSDGDLMEGVSAEAASLAGHLKLGKLIYLYDANDITLDGPTTLAFSTENVAKRYESYGWHVEIVKNGDTDYSAISKAIVNAKSEIEKPSLIIVKTTIGFGSPNKKGTSGVHGSPLGMDELALTKKALGLNSDLSFEVSDAAKKTFSECIEAAAAEEDRWNELYSGYKSKYPELAKSLDDALAGKFPHGWDSEIPKFKPGEDQATRAASGKVLNAIAKKIPIFFGGDADLSVSTSTKIIEGGSFNGLTGEGRNIHYGVREHAMGSIANGIAYHGGLRSFTATFFCFADYMRPALRLAAMNHLPVVFVFTHDSIGLGEDGPTHQPVEHLLSLRSMPGLVTLRPADPNETTHAWRVAMSRKFGPTALVLTRQKTTVLDQSVMGSAEGTARGAYVLYEKDASKTEGIILATGSEVSIALAGAKKLEASNKYYRVVSMPSWELFSIQSNDYREKVLPKKLTKRISIEAGVTLGWEKWIGDEGVAIGVDKYGTSAPDKIIYEKYGLTPDAIASTAMGL
ncbi:MAG: transketolase [Xanthomonadaceae bacterium]|nr:transketolase [Xanthomonadaceae bacterium]